jgi:formate dehydrogenase major subunit
MIEVLLNGKTVTCEPGTTILDLARREGLKIPTLCHDEELNPYGSCWVCAVEVKGRRGFVTSCGTTVSPGMEIVTDSPEIQAARKMALELLISNHYADCEAPCKVACPDHVDIQSYISLIANGQYHEAVKVIKETLPLPLSIGRVCPAFCEKECRRQIVEDPIAIRQLKRFAADQDLEDYWTYVPQKEAEKPQKVAIIGAGPSGLTCGFYLSNQGYSVDVFESNPAAGGWLRYGIPEYRLPKAILDREIELLCVNGMKIHYNRELGKDLNLQSLAADYDAVYLALGAQKAVPMPVKGSDLPGCYLGVDFLKAHALGEAPKLGKKVAVVGGGNTAIDCARTALRLGSEVTIIYRRTRDEMPAEPYEIEAAVHEGVKLLQLTNPVEYKGDEGKLCSVTLEKMKLGEPDKSGRRRPEPTGEFFEEDFDSIIAAISQVPEIELFAEDENKIGTATLPLSRWSTAIVDESSMWTGLASVFAGGDFRRGAATAIEAIADGRLAAEAIGSYLETGEIKAADFRFDAKKAQRVQDVSPTEYAQYPQNPRQVMPELPVKEAAHSFKEVELGYLENDARTEAERCLECGCQVNESCSLRAYCSDYKVEASKFLGSINKHPIDHSHPFILRDANKCINCGRCVRSCSEIQGAAVLGFIYRGFSSVVAPEFGQSLTVTTCESCGKCIAVCPVGALVEKNANYKLNPLLRDTTLQSCGICGTGCRIETQTQTDQVVLIQAPQKDEDRGFNGRNLCFNGRFGWQTLYAPERLHLPRYKEGGIWKDISWAEARKLMAEKTKELKSYHFEISPRISLEEMLMLKAVANTRAAKLYADPALQPIAPGLLPLNPDPKAYEKLDNYTELVVIGKISHTLRTLLRLKQRQGRRLVLINPPEAGFNRFADRILRSLDELEASAGQVFIYNLNEISPRELHKLYTLALKLDPEAKNLWASSNYANYWGLLAMQPCFNLPAEAELALGWGCYPARSAQAKFSIAIQLFADDDAPVDLLLPAPSYLEIEAHTLGDMALPGVSMNPAKSMIINELMRVFYELGWIMPSTAEINHWNLVVEELIAALQSRDAAIPSLDGIDPDTLSATAASPKYIWDTKIMELYERRKPILLKPNP